MIKYCVKLNTEISSIEQWVNSIGAYSGKAKLEKVLLISDTISNSETDYCSKEYLLCFTGTISSYFDNKRFFGNKNVFRYDW